MPVDAEVEVPVAVDTDARAAVSTVRLSRVSWMSLVLSVESLVSSVAPSSPGSVSEPEESPPSSTETVTSSVVRWTSVVTGTPVEHSSSSGVVA